MAVIVGGIERMFGLGGLPLVVFLVIDVMEAPDLGEIGAAFVPRVPALESSRCGSCATMGPTWGD